MGKASSEGTINYLSFAQIRKYKLDWRTDTYQLLLIYYEMLTLEMPYAGLSRTKILEHKLKYDFVPDKKYHINSLIKEVIEKGTRRDAAESFKVEKECIKSLAKIEYRQKRLELFEKYKKPLITVLIIVLCLILSFITYKIWDYETQSVDSIIRNIENNPNPSLEELENAVDKIQTRAFEKKYYEPLLKGEFRDVKTGKPMYPSHLDSNGNWILVGPETESAGMFVGLLFTYSERYPKKYPKLLDYAKEYAEPVLNSEFDGSFEKRYMYALIPGYEKTHDERYLKKLINISDTLIEHFDIESGSTQINDLYQEKLFLYVYNKTGNRKYLYFYNSVVKVFVINNIDSDGYIYLSVDSENSSEGAMHYHMWGRLSVPFQNNPIGNYIELSNNNEHEFKNMTSLFSRDFIEVLITLQDMYVMTNDSDYSIALNRTETYYVDNLPLDKTDNLFISDFNKEYNIPKDTLAAVNSLHFFKEYGAQDAPMYRDKLKALLSKEYFRNENDKSILAKSVFIENMRYDNLNLNLRNQSLIETDALFLELK